MHRPLDVAGSGTMRDRYRPLARLGRGGMAELWLGVVEGAVGFRRPVVFKRAMTDDPDDDLSAANEALVREAHIAALLNHPNIIHVYALIDPPEGLMIVMEHLDGLSARAVLEHARHEGIDLPVPVALRIALDAARGLEHAHRVCDAAGKPIDLVHADISPENLVTTADGITKLVDFGISRSALRAENRRVPMGKLRYVSPEQCRGAPLDARSDVFSLGVVLHELLEGEPLVKGEETDAIVRSLLQLPFPVASRAPTVVRNLLAQMLARQASAREISSGMVANTLERAGAASHDDVRRFFAAEFGEVLDARRAQVAELLTRPVLSLPRVTTEYTASGFALDRMLMSSRGKKRAANDTGPEVDATLVDAPWEVLS